MSTIYSKDSFDRFGDDLCEVLISYLSFEQKFRTECVSKQWKRLVFNKQNILIISSDLCEENSNKVDVNRVQTILKKCSDITCVEIEYWFNNEIENRSQVFEVIIKYCNHLNAIQSDFNGLTENTSKDFFNKFGLNLNKILFNTKDLAENQSILKFCPNVSQLNRQMFHKLSLIFDGNTLTLKKLKSLSFAYSESDSKRLEMFAESNRNSLQSIDIFDRSESEDYLTVLYKTLPKLTKLIELQIDRRNPMYKSLIDCLLDMSEKCIDLKKIDLFVRFDSNEMFNTIYKTVNSFKRLKRLHLSLQSDDYESSKPVLRSESLNECKQLTHLTIRGVETITDQFFTDIDKHLPKLQFFETYSAEVSDIALISLAKLPELRSVHLFSFDSKKQISESVVLDLIKKCPKIIKIYFENNALLMDLKDRDIVELRATNERGSNFISPHSIFETH